MALSSEELNFLIYRYLRESGFEHSAFTFGHESFIYKSTLDGAGVAPGSLISLVQKGLQYSEIESHVSLDGTEVICDESFSVLKPHSCRIKQKRRIFDPYEPLDTDFGPLEIDQAIPLHSDRSSNFVSQFAFHGGVGSPTRLAIGAADGEIRIIEFKEKFDEQKSKKTSGPQRFFTELCKFNGKSVKVEEKKSESEAVKVEESAASEINEKDGANKKRKLDSESVEASKNNSVTSLVWNSSGSELASGHYNGEIKIWNLKGEIIATANRNSGPISALKFSKSGKFLLSSSVDGSVSLFSPSLVLLKRFLTHSGPVLDVDWSPNEKNFVSAGTDGNIFLCSTSEEENAAEPIKFLSPHTGDVNSVRFDSSGNFVASGGDDRNVKIFNSTGSLVHSFKDHLRPVLNVRWSLDNEKFPSQPLMLASSSADSSVNLYSISATAGSLLFTLAKHAHPVTALEFQPGNSLLVSASHDRVHLWSTNDGTMVKSFRSEGDGGINSLVWDSVGRRIAVAYSDGPAYILDLQL